MGEITVSVQDMDHLLCDPARAYGTPYQRAYAELAAKHCGQPVTEMVPLLRAAADKVLLGFTTADLTEQAEAISSGARYELRIRVRELRRDTLANLIISMH
ncbi:hypothetical protein [Streptomyces sp. NBC_00094]|uniref:hypothetical protein n=1 Tax=Streptomyces sp. NBC_00094 TaxID=2903620 RepID=UPI002259126A|nr:hypothetical protein [Streptomyces sp. NBC_00094]MCX5388494.1 hypothetical protein [Streptomyces sp. NBC_00094]